jgi:hypothetical protein
MAIPNTTIDPNKSWVFHFGSLVKNEVPIKMQQKNDILSFSIPFDGQRSINIELFSYHEAEKTVEGKYSFGSSKIKDPVFFKVLEEGKRLQGTPKGFFSRQVWAISAKD